MSNPCLLKLVNFFWLCNRYIVKNLFCLFLENCLKQYAECCKSDQQTFPVDAEVSKAIFITVFISTETYKARFIQDMQLVRGFMMMEAHSWSRSMCKFSEKSLELNHDSIGFVGTKWNLWIPYSLIWSSKSWGLSPFVGKK